MYGLYTSKCNELPLERISGLGRGSTFKVLREGGRIESYEYSWPDLKVRVTVMPEKEIQEHLRGFKGYIASTCRKLNVALPEGLFNRIDQTRLVLGFYAEPDMDAEGRADEILGAIACNTKSLIFHGGKVYDDTPTQIFPPLERAPRSAENTLPPTLN
jgi:hypothetical protein